MGTATIVGALDTYNGTVQCPDFFRGLSNIKEEDAEGKVDPLEVLEILEEAEEVEEIESNFCNECFGQA